MHSVRGDHAGSSARSSKRDLAYVVAPTTLSFQRKGKLVKDKGILTVTLRKGASGWRMTAWVWSDD
jgi:ketosteroid isomerase-like protein